MISIIVLHHDKAEYSRACLESILLSSARPLEVINIDNGSRDDTPRVLEEWSQDAREAGIKTQLHCFDTNAGAIVGRNTALQMARGEHSVFLDNDTLVAQRDWLETLRDFLDADAQRAIVAPKMIFPWQPFDIECCGCGVSARGRIQYIGRGEARDSLTEPFVVQCAISACWMMPRRWSDRIGLLDEIYSPVQYEDLDLCYRAREMGGEVWALPAVEVFHFEHTTTSKSDDINFKYVTTKNGVTFKRRWSQVFHIEGGPTEEESAWKLLDRLDIHDVDWRALLPQ
jgi:GT2 family glycosyltransferase